MVKTREEIYIGRSDLRDFALHGEGFLYCEQGECTVMVEFQKYRLRKGYTLYMAPDLYQRFEEATPDFTAFYFIGTEGFLEKVQYGLPPGFYDHVYTHPLMACDDNLLALLRLMESYNGVEEQPRRHLILTDLIHAFYLAYELKVSKTGEPARSDCPAHIERQCRHFYRLVQEHFREHRDVGFYAGELCVTANYLAVIIRKYCRETPKLAITRQTVSELKYQLIYTSKSIEQIAKELHFPDTSYMCRYFRRTTGRALDEYRKEMK